jgi:hypothetical protein
LQQQQQQHCFSLNEAQVEEKKIVEKQQKNSFKLKLQCLCEQENYLFSGHF